MDEYTRQPVHDSESIRLLVLTPGAGDDPIQCRLKSAPIARYRYEALSYTWGPPEPSAEIRCGSNLLRVTQNCYDALVHLRDPAHSRVLWIDAICINQKSLSERNRQVKLMDQIYSQADKVLVWLGTGGEKTDAAIEYIQKLESENPRKERSRRRRDEGRAVHHSKTNLSQTATMKVFGDSGIFNRVHTLLENDYFSRMWPIQEVTLSNTCVLICGRQSLGLPVFLELLQRFDNVIWSSPTLQRTQLHKSLYLHFRSQSGHPVRHVKAMFPGVSQLLLYARRHKATEPRDKVFALYGILRRLGSVLEDPDYARSIGSIYCEASTKAMTFDNHLEILSGLTGAQRPKYCPSWALDLSDDDPINEVGLWQQYTTLWSNTKPKPKFQISPRTRRLILRGQRMDVLDEIGDSFPDVHTTQGITSFSAQACVINKWLYMFSNDFQNEDVLQLLHDAIIAVWSKRLSHDSLNLMKLLRFWLDSEVLSDSRQSKQAVLDNGPESLAFNKGQKDRIRLADIIGIATLRGMLTQLLDRKVMFRTESGRLGFGSQHVRTGDDIVLLCGANLPMIVRPRGRKWAMIAPAYVQGLVRAEGDVPWPAPKKRMLEQMVFV